MHDETLDKEGSMDLDIQGKYIYITTLELAKHYKIAEAKATVVLGFIMQKMNSYPSTKDIIINMNVLAKKPMKLLTNSEREALLASGHLIRKFDPVEAGKNLPGRNDACLCGSGKKYKLCCLGKPILKDIARPKNV